MSLHRERTHPEYVEGCFGCKVGSLQMSDVRAHASLKHTDRELNAYRDARKQGIQPRSTRMTDIVKAEQTSQLTGRAYGTL